MFWNCCPARKGPEAGSREVEGVYTCTNCITWSVQLYGWDDTFHTGVHPRRVDAQSCSARITTDVQLCGRCDVCRAPVHSDSFAMRSSTYDLAGSGLTFEIMRFGSNTGRDFNYHLDPRRRATPRSPRADGQPFVATRTWTDLEGHPWSSLQRDCLSPRIRNGIAAGRTYN